MVSISTSNTDRSIYANCTYINKAPSSGCYLILIETYNSYYFGAVVSASGKKFVNLLPGRYAAFVYGMEGEHEFTLSHTHNFYAVLDIVPTTAVVISDEATNSIASSKESIMQLGIMIPECQTI